MNSRAIVFLISVTAVFAILESNAFATSEFKEIEKLTDMEKTEPQEHIIRPQVEYNAGGLRNPFKALTEKAGAKSEVEPGITGKGEEEIPPLPKFTVQGIVWGGNFPQAIINNKVVKAGDSIEGCVIKDISKEGITLLFKGFEYKLYSPAAGGKI